MNLKLVDPFVLAQDCPESITGSLRSGHGTCIRFSHRGDLLASGRLDGTVAIFDIETNGVARKLRGHTAQIQSLSWSSNDRFILTASQDWKAVLWDLKDGSRVRTVRFEAPVFIAELHPQNHLVFVAALFEEQPMLVDISTSNPVKRPLPSAPRRTEDELSEKQAAQDAKITTTVTCFTASGDHIIAGTNKGWINIIDSRTCQTLYSNRLTNSIIILIRATSAGRDLVINSSDRIIRTLRIPDLNDPTLDWESVELELEHKFQDLVNRLSWNYVTFSNGNGDYVCASTYMNHDIYVWERSHGSLVKILEGPREELSAVDWHPHRPFVAAVGVEAGRVFLWSILTPQRWSALAPDFMEVEENVEYEEHEDEFDIQPAEELDKRRADAEDEEVDVLTVEPTKGAEWYEPGDFKMPVIFDIDGSDSEDDIIAIGVGEFRRKNAGQDWSVVPTGTAVREPAGNASGDERKANGSSSRSGSHSAAKRRRAE